MDTVMAFRRWGMRGAQPLFNLRGLLYDLTALKTGDSDDRISRIEHPDAEAIAHSWEDVHALLAHAEALAEQVEVRDAVIRDKDELIAGDAERATKLLEAMKTLADDLDAALKALELMKDDRNHWQVAAISRQQERDDVKQALEQDLEHERAERERSAWALQQERDEALRREYAANATNAALADLIRRLRTPPGVVEGSAAQFCRHWQDTERLADEALASPQPGALLLADRDALVKRVAELEADRAALKAERDAVDTNIMALLERIPGAIRVREGGGPEDVLKSLAVSVGMLTTQVEAMRCEAASAEAKAEAAREEGRRQGLKEAAEEAYRAVLEAADESITGREDEGAADTLRERILVLADQPAGEPTAQCQRCARPLLDVSGGLCRGCCEEEASTEKDVTAPQPPPTRAGHCTCAGEDTCPWCCEAVEREDGEGTTSLRGGPETCPRPCSECADGLHHWIDVAPDMDDPGDEDAQHEAAVKHGLAAWYTCKHCDAWQEDVDEDEECEA